MLSTLLFTWHSRQLRPDYGTAHPAKLSVLDHGHFLTMIVTHFLNVLLICGVCNLFIYSHVNFVVLSFMEFCTLYIFITSIRLSAASRWSSYKTSYFLIARKNIGRYSVVMSKIDCKH